MGSKAPHLMVAPLTAPPTLLRSIIQPSFAASQRRCFGIKSLERPKENRFNEGPGLPPLLATKHAAFERLVKSDTLPKRTGALAIKKGMTAIYDRETGQRIPCTVLQLEQNQVVFHKTKKEHGYYAVCVGAGEIEPKNVSKPQLGHFSTQGVSPKRYLQEFRVADKAGLLAVGELIKANWFIEGQLVDTRANCKGKGFQGVMKRWGFGGQPRSHGHSLSHRSLGSTGNGQGGGSRVYPGKKMPGNMGGQRVTVQNLRVLQTDPEKGILLVNGAVSGPKGGIVMIQDALKKPFWPEIPPSSQPASVEAS